MAKFRSKKPKTPNLNMQNLGDLMELQGLGKMKTYKYSAKDFGNDAKAGKRAYKANKRQMKNFKKGLKYSRDLQTAESRGKTQRTSARASATAGAATSAGYEARKATEASANASKSNMDKLNALISGTSGGGTSANPSQPDNTNSSGTTSDIPGGNFGF